MRKLVLFSTILAVISLPKFDALEFPNQDILSYLKRFQLTPPVPVKDALNPQTSWLEQKLDHFNASDLRTWKQKYYINRQWYEQGGPVFVFIGGEGALSQVWTQGGQVAHLAKKYHAAIYALEHRFYGESRPTADLTIESLKYLSADQALADLASLIRLLREDQHANEKLVVFGGSYAGNLAAWAKLRYPHLIDGAVASCAPVLAQVDFPEYLEVVANAMNDSHETCWSEMNAGINAISEILKEEQGSANISRLFNLCTPLDVNNKQEVAHFFSLFSIIVSSTVQYADSLIDVREFCSDLTDPANGQSPLERLAALVAREFLITTCFPYTYAEFIKAIGNTNYGQGFYRQWFYQTCTEYGYYQTSTSPVQPFGEHIKVQFYLQWCKDAYSTDFDEAFVYKAVTNTNKKYGGKNPQVKDVIFVHGSFDPWHVLGVLEDLTAPGQVIMIEGSSHCADFQTPSSSDSDALTEARSKIEAWVGRWVDPGNEQLGE